MQWLKNSQTRFQNEVVCVKPNNIESIARQLVSYTLTFVTTKHKYALLNTEKQMQTIIQHWLRILYVRLGWIHNFDTIVLKYAKFFQLLKVLRGHSGPVRSVRFSFDGCRVISGSDDHTVRIWDIASGQQIQIFHTPNSLSGIAKFSPDGNIIALYSWNITNQFLDVKTGKEVRLLNGNFGRAYAMDFSPDGKNIAIGLHDGVVQLWNVKNGKEIISSYSHSESVRDVNFSSDNKMLVSCSDDTTISVLDVKSCKILIKLKGHSHSVLSVKFSPDNKFVVSCSLDKTIRIWNLQSGDEVMQFEGHSYEVKDVKYFPDGKIVASCSADKTLRLWDVTLGCEIDIYPHKYTKDRFFVEQNFVIKKNSLKQLNPRSKRVYIDCLGNNFLVFKQTTNFPQKIGEWTANKKQKIASRKCLRKLVQEKSLDGHMKRHNNQKTVLHGAQLSVSNHTQTKLPFIFLKLLYDNSRKAKKKKREGQTFFHGIDDKFRSCMVYM
ncbi:G-protein beta WD-40 repeats containing protein [Reticulomyxa filosa]|uniref:G-protein beta WD-40 repeats containing protein n=1 Tax=Reticulomyxa filosa TaxID=46433 RepID=X6MZ71_RETFI|nr:G-protein beta WD-40 repeats containing protein [Reticulomyxa filosa]|eukprot:ETO19121.1 G-protein beta WD-40 repeats containing protein [Reticulomyxa filosa]